MTVNTGNYESFIWMQILRTFFKIYISSTRDANQTELLVWWVFNRYSLFKKHSCVYCVVWRNLEIRKKSMKLLLYTCTLGCPCFPKTYETICLSPLSHCMANSGHKMTKIFLKGSVLGSPLFTWKNAKNTKDSPNL